MSICNNCCHWRVCVSCSTHKKECNFFEAERPHGEWIFHKYDKNYECSNCHIRFDRTQIYTEKHFENALWAKMEIYSFCPHCGADMIKRGLRAKMGLIDDAVDEKLDLEYFKIGSTTYTQDDDKQGWTGREGE